MNLLIFLCTIGVVVHQCTSNGESSVDLTESNGEGQTKNNGESLADNNGEILTENNGEILTENNGESPTEKNGESLTEKNGESLAENNGESPTENIGESLTETSGEHFTEDGGESFTKSVQLFNFADSQIKDMKDLVQAEMEKIGRQQKKLANDMRNECQSYINEALDKVKEIEKYPDAIQSKIYGCTQALNRTIADSTSKFIKTYEKAHSMISTVIIHLQQEPTSFDSDEIHEQIDEIVDYFYDKFETTINPALESILKLLKMNAVSVPLNVKKCIDKILN